MPIDYKQYPPHWKELRRQVLKRAKERCEQCNVRNGVWIFRGYLDGLEVYQDGDGAVYRADDSYFIMLDLHAPIVPMHPKNSTIKVVLTVAHLDHDATNHAVTTDRLKALCQRCHIRLDAPVKAAKIKARNEANKSMGLFNETEQS